MFDESIRVTGDARQLVAGHMRLAAMEAGVALTNSNPITSGRWAGHHEALVCLACWPGDPCCTHAAPPRENVQ